ncbi:peptidoglycan DD-metalloendopeptidase family protein [Marinobacter maritimus]|mgnify:FL=1|uniref:peptidoglycan DD-metalloendopeptidase family protein n=1 Tax=Marinobacter maritimus TaxID=277961 RepID=UPI00119F0D61|nr:peptidoglycan DD-metalloendopeptidase family protein [Marinobacter maritimus]
MLKMFPKAHITIAAATTVVVTAAILMSPSADVEAKRMSYALDLEQGGASEIQSQKSQPTPAASAEPSVNASTAAGPTEVAQEIPDLANVETSQRLDWQTFNIKSGDTLSSLFKKAGFNDGVMLSVIHGEGEADKLQRLYAGETIRFATDNEGELAAIELQRSLLESLKIEKQEGSFKGETNVREPETKPAFAYGTIDGSLYLAAREAGLNDRLTMELAGIFGWDIDFVYDVRKGDQFEVVYEELYLDGEKFNTGRILSARFINRGEDNIALLYTDSKGDSDYYTPDGKSMRKAFLRTPISARVSSAFNLQRRHPVLDVVRPHEGTDYAAPPGTPIKAAGNGRVQFAGWKGGYGRTVVLKHGDNITTLYAHMSRVGKGMKSGTRVKQGETIGYVGSSGMVTGPHLHYEFRVNGSPRNSRTVKLPDAQPIPASEMAQFKKFTEQQVAQFEAFRANYQQLALAPED